MSTAVAVGVFDGLHLGHAAILEQALARAAGARCVVISFDPHPDVVLAKHFQAVAPLTPIPEKRARLAAMGIRELDVLPFTRELAALEPEAFVSRHLVTPFTPRWLVVGEDFALGRGREGTPAALRELGVDATAPQHYSQYNPDYYSTFFTDPDGIRLELVCRTPYRDALVTHWDEFTVFLNPLAELRARRGN